MVSAVCRTPAVMPACSAGAVARMTVLNGTIAIATPTPVPMSTIWGSTPAAYVLSPSRRVSQGNPGADDDEATHGTDPEVHGGEETGQALRGEQQRDAEGQNRQAAPQRVEALDVLQVLDEVDEETGEQQQPREGARQLPVGEDGPGAWASSQCRKRGGTSPGR